MPSQPRGIDWRMHARRFGLFLLMVFVPGAIVSTLEAMGYSPEHATGYFCLGAGAALLAVDFLR